LIERDELQLDSIFSRKSIRYFKEQEVEREKTERLLAAAMAAPTACNQREWEFVVADRKDVLAELAAASPYAGPAGRAPAAIVVVCSRGELKHPDYFQQDMAAACENILVEAESLGLGAVWLGIAPEQDRMDKVAAALGLPDDIIPFSIIPFGYPAEKREAGDRLDKSKVYCNQYGTRFF